MLNCLYEMHRHELAVTCTVMVMILHFGSDDMIQEKFQVTIVSGKSVLTIYETYLMIL